MNNYQNYKNKNLPFKMKKKILCRFKNKKLWLIIIRMLIQIKMKKYWHNLSMQNIYDLMIYDDLKIFME